MLAALVSLLLGHLNSEEAAGDAVVMPSAAGMGLMRLQAPAEPVELSLQLH